MDKRSKFKTEDYKAVRLLRGNTSKTLMQVTTSWIRSPKPQATKAELKQTEASMQQRQQSIESRASNRIGKNICLLSIGQRLSRIYQQFKKLNSKKPTNPVRNG